MPVFANTREARAHYLQQVSTLLELAKGILRQHGEDVLANDINDVQDEVDESVQEAKA